MNIEMNLFIAFESAMMTSLLKILLTLALVLIWAKWATIVDKDAAYYYLPRQMWNLINMGGFVVSMVAILLIPFFLVGYVIAIGIIFGLGAYYVVTRNKAAPEHLHWHFGAEMLQELILERKQTKATKEASIQFMPHGSPKTPPLQEEADYPSHMAFEEIMEPALAKNAMRIELSGTTRLSGMMVVDNRMVKLSNPPSEKAKELLKYIKDETTTVGEDGSRSYHGQTKILDKETGEHELDIQITSSSQGLKCVIEIDKRQRMEIPYAELGFSNEQKAQMAGIIENPERAILVTSPAKHGRSTTFYSLLANHDPYTLTIHTFESEVELEVEGATQVETDADELPPKLKSLLLQEPSVIGISNVSSNEIAKGIASASSGEAVGTPFRVYAGLPANDSLGAIKTWAKAVGDLNAAGDSLGGVINQRLVRKLCITCRQAYKPDPEALKKMNLSASKVSQLYKSSGKIQVKNEKQPCPACGGIGYRGLTAVYEVVVIDAEGREMIKAGKLDALKQHLKSQKTIWLQEAALAKVVEGVTSLSEVSEALSKKKS